MGKANEVIQAIGLTKLYNGFRAVDGISFQVKKGECFGFLGPNGAGKTTTVKMIYCFSPPTSGILRVFGLDVRKHPREIKKQIGVVFQEDNLDPELTVGENLYLHAGYFRIPAREAAERIKELLALLELGEKAPVLVEELSGGMKRRLAIARALINHPRALILDEPTTGLDPQARHLVWQRLRQLQSWGVTLLLTTHYLEEASYLCNRLVIMDQGRILEEGEPQALVSKHIGKEVLELGGVSPEVQEALLKEIKDKIYGYQSSEDVLFLYPQRGRELLRWLQSNSYEFTSQLLRPATLEDVFLKLTGRALHS